MKLHPATVALPIGLGALALASLDGTHESPAPARVRLTSTAGVTPRAEVGVLSPTFVQSNDRAAAPAISLNSEWTRIALDEGGTTRLLPPRGAPGLVYPLPLQLTPGADHELRMELPVDCAFDLRASFGVVPEKNELWTVHIQPALHVLAESSPARQDAIVLWHEEHPVQAKLESGVLELPGVADTAYSFYGLVEGRELHFVAGAESELEPIATLSSPRPPLVDGNELPPDTLLLPGRADFEAIRSIVWDTGWAPVFCASVEERSKLDAVLTNSPWRTAWHPELGIAYLLPDEEGRWLGRWETGELILRVPDGYELDGHMCLRAGPPGRGEVRLLAYDHPLRTSADSEEVLRARGLPFGRYTATFELALRGPDGSCFEVEGQFARSLEEHSPVGVYELEL